MSSWRPAKPRAHGEEGKPTKRWAKETIRSERPEKSSSTFLVGFTYQRLRAKDSQECVCPSFRPSVRRLHAKKKTRDGRNIYMGSTYIYVWEGKAADISGFLKVRALLHHSGFLTRTSCAPERWPNSCPSGIETGMETGIEPQFLYRLSIPDS